MRLIQHDSTTCVFKPKWHMDQMLQPFVHFRLQFGLHEQQQKSPSAGAEELPSQSADLHGLLVQMVDLRRRNLARKASLTEPALVEQSAHFLDRRLRILEDLDGFIHHLLHAPQLGFPALKVRDLGLGDLGRNSRKSRETQHQMRLKLMQPIFGQDDG